MVVNTINVAQALLHVFSALVSFHVVDSFLGNYVANEQISMFISSIVVLAIEVCIYTFMQHSITIANNGDDMSKYSVYALAGSFLALSMFLTTIGASDVAISHFTPKPMLIDDSNLTIVKETLEADRIMLLKLQKRADKRRWKGHTKDEQRTIEILNKRIAQNNEMVIEQTRLRQEGNAKIEMENESAKRQLRETHSSFGFITQLVIILLMFARNTLKTTKTTANATETTAETIIPVVAQKEKRSFFGDKISTATKERVIHERLQDGATHQSVSSKVGVAKSTVTKICHGHIEEVVKAGHINTPKEFESLCAKLGVKITDNLIKQYEGVFN